jgi:hypothetical protein
MSSLALLPSSLITRSANQCVPRSSGAAAIIRTCSELASWTLDLLAIARSRSDRNDLDTPVPGVIRLCRIKELQWPESLRPNGRSQNAMTSEIVAD